MNWPVIALLAAYISVCEARVPAPYQACEARWNVALGVLVPSPLPGVTGAAASIAQRLIRRRRPEEEQP